MPTPVYTPRRAPRSRFVAVRSLRYHLQEWGDAALASPGRPPLVLLHGWMDVGASFQFTVDALARADGFDRWIVAPDWRGFGRTEGPPGADAYWFPDYLGDLDALLDAIAPADRHAQVDLAGHSMGGNVAMGYAGVRPARVRRLANLEGFGLPRSRPDHAPERLAQWLDELARPVSLPRYADADEVVRRLLKNAPLTTPDKAAWLAPHWAEPQADGRWAVRGDAAHKRANPVPYQVAETLETWKRIAAPVLWVEGDRSDLARWWGDRYPRAEFEERIAVVPRLERAVLSPCGHMLHLEQPQALAERLAGFLR